MEKELQLKDNSSGINYPEIVGCKNITKLIEWYDELAIAIVGLQNNIENTTLDPNGDKEWIRRANQILRIKKTLSGILKIRIEFYHLIN